MQSIPAIDLYRELEVDPSATAETIDAAWKSLLKRYHPDVAAASDGALERVKRINLAHDWLGDPARRALYDRSRRRPAVVRIYARQPAADPRPRPRSGEPGSERPRSAGPRSDGSGPATGPSHAPPQPPGGSPPQAGKPGSARTGAPRMRKGDSRRGPSSAASSGRHNPYAEYPHPGRMFAAGGMPLATFDAVPAGNRFPALLLPIALVSVLMVVAISSYLASIRTAPAAANPAVNVATASPGRTLILGGNGALPSNAADPRGLAPPNLLADLPADCQQANVSRAFTFSAQIGGLPAQVDVVQCDSVRSFGPLVYVVGSSGWDLRAKGGFEDGYAYQAFSGPISGRSADEFGIAWTGGDGVSSHVVLYRVGQGLEAFWDSSAIGLAWSLANFSYQGFADASAGGYLIVTSADLATGTCQLCHDQQLYREFYQWEAVAPVPGLVRSSRQPYGIGP